jgi:hypothetical protein
MVERYGFIPSESGTQNVQGLSTFLSDFVLNLGPITKKNGANDGIMEWSEAGEQLPLVPVHASDSIVTVPEASRPSVSSIVQ